MDDLWRSVPALPRALQRKLVSDFKTLSKRDKIQNVLSLHHSDDKSRSLIVDLKTNSVTANHGGDSKKIHKTFLFDSISSKDNDVCHDVLVAAIRGVAEKKDSFLLSASRALKKKATHADQLLVHTLVKWLLDYLTVCCDTNESRYSVRLSALEINEEMDTMTELGSTDEEGRAVTLDNQYCHRCVDSDSAEDILSHFYSSAQSRDRTRCQYLYTVHVYHHMLHSSVGSSVSSQCSRIYFLSVDLTKHKNNDHHISPPGLAKLLMSSLNRNNDRPEMDSFFQNMLFDIVRKHASNFSMMTNVSMKEKHSSDTYQMLQLASRVQRVKVRSKKSWDTSDCERPNRPTMGTSVFRKVEKFSDTEVASTSEMSCAETVIFLGEEERRRNSDDESRRFRSMFMSSDSDSGYRDWKLSRSGGSRGATPVNESRKQVKPRTNALVWPKSALKMAKTTLLHGQELWVDGPNALKKAVDMSGIGPLTVSTSSTPETLKQSFSPCCQAIKPLMVCQETQCDDLSSVNMKNTPEDIRPLSDISEITEDNDTLRNSKNNQRKDEYRFMSPTSPQNVTSDEYSNIERNDVQNLSDWIHDVNELTSYQESLTRSLHENLMPNKHFLPVLNESLNSHNYQYYDPGSQGEYNSFPRVYTQIQYTQNNLCAPMAVRCCSITSEFDKDQTTDLTKRRNPPLECHNKERATKSKSFSPFELLKKTLMRKKKKYIPEKDISDSQCCVPRCPELTYLMPAVHSPDDSSDSTSSDSECNEWFRNVKTFKSKAECQKNKCTSIRPPSAPLLAGSAGCVQRSQYSFRQRSSSSGYGSVVTRDSEMSSHHDSTSDQSIQSSLMKNVIKQSISFSQPSPYNPVMDDLDPELISQRCELLVKQEKAFLLIQQQEMMVHDFYTTTRPLLTKDQNKYTLRISTFDINRVSGDNQYLEELEEDTNIIRDSIAFYKSLVQLESSFVTSPDTARRNIH